MNLEMVMKGIVKLAMDLTQFREDQLNPVKEKPQEVIDITDSTQVFDDDDSDEDFDDADEEVDIYYCS
jgi:hypothetical protein